jgi:large subunit ribosomal protein L14
MKGIPTSVRRGLSVGSKLVCADNSGAKILQIISVRGFKGRRRTKPMVGLGGEVKCRVYKGNEKVRHEMFRAVIVRQKKECRRADGMTIHFEDNAAVLLDERGDTKGTLIKGPVAKEAVIRFPSVGKVASIVV